MQTVVLTRDHMSVPWGFRLKGGIEYNVPLSILKVNENSPAHQRLEIGDTLLNIGNFSAGDLRHEEALNLIRMFDLTLPLVVRRDSSSHFATATSAPPQVSNVPKIAAKPAASSSSGVWRPPSLSSQPEFSSSPQTNSFYHPAAPAPYSSYNQFAAPESHYQGYHNPIQFQAAAAPPPPPPPPAIPPPPPPPLPVFDTPIGYKPGASPSQKRSNVHQLASHLADSNSSLASTTSGGHVPDVLGKIMGGGSGGRKPFTYTPGGLDLSHIRNSGRVKKYEQHQQEIIQLQQQQLQRPHEQQQQQQQQPMFGIPSSYQHHHAPAAPAPSANTWQPPAQTWTPPASVPVTAPVYTAPTPVPVAPKPAPMPSSSYVPPVAAASPSSSSNTLPRANKPKQQMGFNISSEDLQRAKSDKPGNNSMNNQSYSFRMLNRWIEESESSNPVLVSKKDQEEAAKSAQNEKKHTSAVLKALEEEEKHKKFEPKVDDYEEQFRPQVHHFQPPPQQQQQQHHHYQQQQQQQHTFKISHHNGPNTVPSKVFQMLERKYSVESDGSDTAVHRRHSKPNTHEEDNSASNRVPAREREQEGDAPKYKGAAIPSKTFRYLQSLTQEEETAAAAAAAAQVRQSNEKLNESQIDTTPFGGAKNLIKNFEKAASPKVHRYETRSEAFSKSFEPNTESLQQRYEAKTESVSERFEPQSEAIVKTFESSSQSHIVTTTTSNTLIENSHNFDSAAESQQQPVEQAPVQEATSESVATVIEQTIVSTDSTSVEAPAAVVDESAVVVEQTPAEVTPVEQVAPAAAVVEPVVVAAENDNNNNNNNNAVAEDISEF